MPMCGNCFTEVNNGVQCEGCNTPLHAECVSKGEGTRCDTCYVPVKEKKTMMSDFTLPEIIRRSHIENYASCPYAFYLDVKTGDMRHNNEEDTGDGSIYAQLGRDLHILFDQASHGLLSPNQMYDEWDKIWYNYPPSIFDSEEFKIKMSVRAQESIGNFYRILNELPPTPFKTEENLIFSISDDLPKVSITMDRIDVVDGELEMLDWKTGKVMVGQKHATDLQAPLYIYAVKQAYSLPVRKFTFHYLSEGKTRVFERVNEDEYAVTVRKSTYTISLTETIREVKSRFSRMVNGDFNIPRDVKKMFFTCKMCDHRISGACRGAEEESWYQVNRQREVM